MVPVAQNEAICHSPCVCTSQTAPQSDGHLIMENEAILPSKALRVLTGSVSSETLAISLMSTYKIQFKSYKLLIYSDTEQTFPKKHKAKERQTQQGWNQTNSHSQHLELPL